MYCWMSEWWECSRCSGRKFIRFYNTNLHYKQMFKKLIIILYWVTAICAVQLSSTKISAARNSLRTSLCNFYNGNFSDSQRSHTLPIIKSHSYLTDDQIEKMLFYQDFSSPSIQTFLIVAPHAACLMVLIIMVPGLACCCARPEKYPVCKKCRKPEDEIYGRVELKWPGFALILSFITVAVGAAAGSFGGPDVTNHVNNIGCRLTAVIDDTLYGRISPSDDSVFFVGLLPLSSELTDFDSKIDTFFSQSNTSLNLSQQVRTHQVAIQTQIDTEYTSYTNIPYTNAFRQADGVTYQAISSQFKDLFYGPTTDSTKILGNIYSQLQTLFTQINSALDPMIAAWVQLNTETKASVKTHIQNTLTSISTHQIQLNATLKNYQYFDNQTYYNNINLGMKIVYGLVLALALLGILSASILTCCTVVRIRLVIYFACSFLIFMAVITFSMLIVFGAFLPNVSQACNYIDRKMQSGTGVVDLLEKLQFNGSAVLYEKCSTVFGDGDMVDKVNTQFTASYNSIVLLSGYTLGFNEKIPNFDLANFLLPFTQATSKINSVKIANELQINDTIALAFLRALSTKAYTLDPLLCTNPSNVNSDAWVPSRSVISCPAGIYAQNPCLDLSDTVVCPQGCYQLYDQLTNVAGDPTNYNTHINSRYGTGCNYALYVIDLHQKWTLPKISDLANVQTDVDGIKTNVNNYFSRVQTIQGNVNSFKANLIQNFNSQTNVTSGSFNGVDCRVVGESLVELRDSVCVGLLTAIQYNVIMLALISYGVLLLACFSVCAGVRHYLHLQKMQVKVGYKGVPISVSSNRIIDKFDA